ncbi:enoyl-CoA hydratase-related protein [Nocardioides humi]|uniref:enoyl-CoA hydratase-related protein n=1 Tax=Nocardioides humi TaxID=449461 RepID=UPI001C641DB5|nr:enoyl-CoA hydratase-related protein [Nocardioides humi]
MGRITINRPEVLNALRRQTYVELLAAMDACADDHEIGVVIITGAGDRSFCSGGDVRGQRTRRPEEGRSHMRTLLKLGESIRTCGKPVLASVNGYAIGSGHELHLMCDLTIAADTARFGQVGPRVGGLPFWGAVQMLPRTVGEKRAREILFLCEQYTADEALAMGLVNKVVPLSELAAETDAMAQRILDLSPRSLRLLKMLVNHGSDLDHPTYAMGAELLASTFGDDENLEGINAFLEKREPDYRKFRRR